MCFFESIPSKSFSCLTSLSSNPLGCNPRIDPSVLNPTFGFLGQPLTSSLILLVPPLGLRLSWGFLAREVFYPDFLVLLICFYRDREVGVDALEFVPIPISHAFEHVANVCGRCTEHSKFSLTRPNGCDDYAIVFPSECHG